MLDLRLPAGLFFAVTGLILTGLGVMEPSNRAALTPTNVNLYVGLAMLLFGAFLLVLARRSGTRTDRNG
jgi:predicted transporter